MNARDQVYSDIDKFEFEYRGLDEAITMRKMT